MVNCFLTLISFPFDGGMPLFAQIDVLIEDKEFVESLMDGQPWKAGNFSRSLRLSLWLEHLGPVLDRFVNFGCHS